MAGCRVTFTLHSYKLILTYSSERPIVTLGPKENCINLNAELCRGLCGQMTLRAMLAVT